MVRKVNVGEVIEVDDNILLICTAMRDVCLGCYFEKDDKCLAGLEQVKYCINNDIYFKKVDSTYKKIYDLLRKLQVKSHKFDCDGYNYFFRVDTREDKLIIDYSLDYDALRVNFIDYDKLKEIVDLCNNIKIDIWDFVSMYENCKSLWEEQL